MIASKIQIKNALRLGSDYPYDAPAELFTPQPAPVVDWAHYAARGVIANLRGRNTIKWGFEKVEDDTRAEIVSTLAAIIQLAWEESQGNAALE